MIDRRRMPFELLSVMVPLTLRIREQLMTKTQAARQRRRLRYPE
jgi:hypothetical protein